MDCNNKWCTWCSFGQCCHEDEEGHKNATPNKLDCPSALRSDFDEQFIKCHTNCIRKLDKLTFAEMCEVEQFIKSMITNK